jgi:hypothetical protein
MARSSCPMPDNCMAPNRGPCRCQGFKCSPEAIAKNVATMRARSSAMPPELQPEIVAPIRSPAAPVSEYLVITICQLFDGDATRHGIDTRSIASVLGLHESVIYNSLSRRKVKNGSSFL